MPATPIADFPEPDRVEGAPHPRETAHLYGQSEAEAAFLEAFTTGRLHHAWLITGPRGLGKATLAWRIARFLLAAPEDDGGMFAPAPPASLDIPADHPVARRIAALSEPRLYLLRRGLNERETAITQDIIVNAVRQMKEYFSLTAADGGRRVAIIDAADEMNPQAANALLKLLEEPPEKVTFLLISHQPFRLLPTIRSRCRTLRLRGLGSDDLTAALQAAGSHAADPVALAELAGGSVGDAIRMSNLDGLRLYADLVDLLAGLPRLDRRPALTLAESLSGKGREPRFELGLTLLDLLLSRIARAGATGILPPEAAPGEAALLARLAPDAYAARAWADLAQGLGQRARRGRAVNLDPTALLMDMVFSIDATAGQLAAR